MSTTSKVVQSINLYEEKDHRKFKHLKGNRPLDQKHVKRLIKSIEKHGNLTSENPVEVNEKMEILDGQHRIAALKELGMPVYFVIKENLTIDYVQNINTDNKNWSWEDFANRHAEYGNEEYVKFLALAKKYPTIRFSVLLFYSIGYASSSKNRTDFFEGNFEFVNYELTCKLLDQLSEIIELTDISNKDFAIALCRFMRTPNYDHTRMKMQISLYGELLSRAYTIVDYLQALESIYRA